MVVNILKSIKRYEMVDGLTIDELISKWFKQFESNLGSFKLIHFNKCEVLYKDIFVVIDFIQNEDGILSFDDFENVLVEGVSFG